MDAEESAARESDDDGFNDLIEQIVKFGQSHYEKGCEAKGRGASRDENPYHEFRRNFFWDVGWREAGRLAENALFGSFVRSADATFAWELEELREQFEAGDDSALLRAMDQCERHKIPPKSWMNRALHVLVYPSPASKGRHASPQRQYADRRNHALRYQAVAGCRHAFDARVEREREARKCTLEDAKTAIIEKYGRRPSWPMVYENAAILLSKTGAPCTGAVAKKSYELVKRDILENGENSQFVRGMDCQSSTLKWLIWGKNGEMPVDWWPPPEPR